jgi:hypothetical protein
MGCRNRPDPKTGWIEIGLSCMNMNLKLILLGLSAMLVTAVVFTAIEAAILRPEVGMVSPTATSHPDPQAAVAAHTQLVLAENTASPTPFRLLTLSSDPFPATPTTITQIGATLTSEKSPSPGTPDVAGKTESPQPSPTGEGSQPTSSPTIPNIPSGTAGLQGRILFNGSAFNGSVVLRLVDQVSGDVQQFTFLGGEFFLENLQPSSKGYQVIFDLNDNVQFSQNQVTREVILGPLPAESGALVRYPDMEIALGGLEPLEPSPNAVLMDHPISPQQPVRLKWTEYPSLSQYRVELKPGRLSQPVWVSGYVNSDSVVFDGVLMSGALIQPGRYWWSVSARSADGTITVAGPEAEFFVDW